MIKQSLVNLQDPWTGFWLSVQALILILWLRPETTYVVLCVIGIAVCLFAVQLHNKAWQSHDQG